MLGEKNELRSRYLLIGLAEEDKSRIGRLSEKDGLSEKGCQKTADKLLSIIAADNKATQTAMAKTLGISRQAVQKHLANLKASGRLRRIGPDKGGHWEVHHAKT